MTAETITSTIGAVIALCVVWGLWCTGQIRPLFKIKLIGGKPTAEDGTVTAAFLDQIHRVAAAGGIAKGTIRGWPAGKLVRLAFSKEIPEPARQQIRNWWAGNGWQAPQKGLANRTR